MSKRVLSSNALSIEDYLRDIIEYPNQPTDETSSLQWTHGIYDNWPIYFDSPFEDVLALVQDQGNFEFDEVIESENHLFNYKPGTVNLQVRPLEIDLNQNLGSYQNLFETIKDYKGSIMFHCYQKQKMKDVNWQKAIGLAVIDICKLSQERKIPFVLPHSISERAVKENDVEYADIRYLTSYQPK